VKGFDFDVAKAEQIFDLLLKEKQLKLLENHKKPMAQELQGRPYCKWHHLFTHATNDCKELRRQIQLAIEQGRLILSQHTIKVDSQPFPQANMVGLSDLTFEGQNFVFRIIMVGSVRRRDEQRKKADSGKRPQDEDESEQQHITEEQVRHIRNQLPASNRLLEKYEYQYKLRRRYESEEEEYEHRTGRTLGRRQAVRDHWHCPFFWYCRNSGMSRLPTINDCLECRPRGRQSGETSVFRCLGPKARHDDHVERPPRDDLELEGEDKYHRP
jgi:hypothetical protein